MTKPSRYENIRFMIIDGVVLLTLVVLAAWIWGECTILRMAEPSVATRGAIFDQERGIRSFLKQ